MTFQFTRDDVIYRVHSEVGEGPARVVVEELELHPAPDLEPSEEAIDVA